MYKIKFHKTFWLLAAVLIFQDRYIYLLSAVIGSILHELGHARAAYNKGYTLKKITIMPYGAVLYGGEKIAAEDGVYIAIAGPIVNVLLSFFTVAFWWIIPASYGYTLAFCQTNLMIAVFNLLPIYPLDGSRIILSLTKNKLKTLKTLRLLGIIFAAILFILFILSLFYRPNPSIGVMSIMVFISAKAGTQKEGYAHIATLAPYTKNLDHPLQQKTLVVSHNLPLIKLLKQIKSTLIIEFKIIDDQMNTIKTLTENQLSDLCLNHRLSTRLRDIFQNLP